MIRKLLLFLALLAGISACEQALIQEEYSDTATEHFELFWREFDRYYSYFPLKQLDWDVVYDTYRPLAGRVESEGELLLLFCEIVLLLEDGHVDLYTPMGRCSYDFAASAPVNSPVHASRYLIEEQMPNSSISYGKIDGEPRIGYLRIFNFFGDASNYDAVDEALAEFADAKAVIVDVRSNPGGSDANSLRVARRFADQRRLYRRHKYRVGPEHDAFSDWFETHVEPGGPGQFTGPVFVLANRSSFSSAEDFVLAMRQFPYVQTVGDTTAGGVGNPVYRELPNGWSYRFSTWVMEGPDGFNPEGIGFPPDHLVNISRQDSLAMRDVILEKAIELAQ